MGIAGFVLSLVAGFFMLIGLVPFLGFINWFTTLPAAVVSIIFSAVGMSKSKNGLAVAGLVISIVVICIAVIRLIVGFGVL
jgi:hypothetical protein